MIRLGEEFPRPEVVLPPDPTDERLLMLFDAVVGLREALNDLPVPQVHVAAPDLGEIVTAVNGLRPGADPEDIGRAIARYLQPPSASPAPDLAVLDDLASTLRKLEFRMNAPGPAMAGPYSVTVPGISQDSTLADVKRGITDFESRLDYDGRTDMQPVYIGRADNGTATSSGSWTVEKVTYVSDRPTRKQVLSGAWDDRASLSW